MASWPSSIAWKERMLLIYATACFKKEFWHIDFFYRMIQKMKKDKYLPECGHSDNSVPESGRYTRKVRIWYIFFGIIHDSREDNDSHSE